MKGFSMNNYSQLKNKDGQTVEAPSIVTEPTSLPKSKQSANTLFHFMGELEHLKKAIQSQKLYPRYCTEEYSFLPSGFPYLTFPMKCFCDIYLEKLYLHCSDYGSFGIGFHRDAMLDKGLQPIQYINPGSDTGNRLSTKAAKFLKENGSDVDQSFFYSDLFSRLKFTKPLNGMVKDTDKFLPDEKEWRYVPKVDENSSIDPFLVIHPLDINNQDSNNQIKNCSNEIEKKNLYPLEFNYSDIKYLLVPGKEESKALSAYIWELDDINASIRLELITKIIELDNIKDDM